MGTSGLALRQRRALAQELFRPHSTHVLTQEMDYDRDLVHLYSGCFRPMKVNWRSVLAAAGGVGVIVVALTKIGNTPVAPGLDTGFRGALADCPEGSACFETDAGDLKALVTLWFEETESASGTWHAELVNGAKLSVSAAPVGGPGTKLTISKVDTISNRSKFDWPSGVTLRVWNDSTRPFTLENWRLDVPDKEGFDSEGRAQWRQVWFVVCLILIAVVVLAAISEQLRKSSEPEWDLSRIGTELARVTISQIEVSAGETPIVRSLLEAVILEGVLVDHALAKVAPNQSRRQQLQLWLFASNRFRRQWAANLSKLPGYTLFNA